MVSLNTAGRASVLRVFIHHIYNKLQRQLSDIGILGQHFSECLGFKKVAVASIPSSCHYGQTHEDDNGRLLLVLLSPSTRKETQLKELPADRCFSLASTKSYTDTEGSFPGRREGDEHVRQ